MFKKKTYHNVVEMVRDVGNDPAFAEDLALHLAGRRLVRRLFALRWARGLSQRDVAEKTGCTQGRISKLEASRDEDLSLGDLQGYARALGLTTILGLESGPTPVARVKFHQACLRSEVDTLARLALKDDLVAKGVARFFGKTASSFLTILEDATRTLPADAQSPGVGLEIVGPEEDRPSAVVTDTEEKTPRKPRRPRKPEAPCG